MGGSSGPTKEEKERDAANKAAVELSSQITKDVAAKATTGTTALIGGEQRYGEGDISAIRKNQDLGGRSAYGRGATMLTGMAGTKTSLGA
jgi:hypothetical protein